MGGGEFVGLEHAEEDAHEGDAGRGVNDEAVDGAVLRVIDTGERVSVLADLDDGMHGDGVRRGGDGCGDAQASLAVTVGAGSWMEASFAVP